MKMILEIERGKMYRLLNKLYSVVFIGFLAVSFTIIAAEPAKAVLEIDITQGVSEPMPIAVTEFFATDALAIEVGRSISEVVTNDLESSGLFRAIEPSTFIQGNEALQQRPDFAAWRLISSDALVSGSVTAEADGRLRVEFRLWDVYSESQAVGRAYVTTEENWRRIAHIISDAIYERLTGETGYFDTRIVYIAESGPFIGRVKRLAIMDQDGANHQYLTNGDTLVLTPRFSPTAQEITYMSYYNDQPRVYLFNIDTGRIEILGDFPGMTFAPRFSPDGDKVIMSLALGGNSDIYTLDLRTRRVEQLTNHPAIDTAPSYSPDGEHIVFESDRGGSQQIYVMDADGRNATRISFGAGRYGTPVWSPRGDLIAFTKMNQGSFDIGVMRPDGDGERILSHGEFPTMVEGPTWSPNGRVITFFRQWPSGPNLEQRNTELYAVDLTGRNLREIPTPQFASDPAWSPLLPINRP